MKDILVTMAGDSYHVKTSQVEVQSQCCHACKFCRWGVVLTLVLAALSLATMAALTVSFAGQMEELRTQIRLLDHRVTIKHDVVEQLRAFQNGIGDATGTEAPDMSEEDHNIALLEPTYPETDHELPVEDKVAAVRPGNVPPLLPAAAGLSAVRGHLGGFAPPAPQRVLSRRAIAMVPGSGSGHPSREPQLQLYHTLQTDPPRLWSGLAEQQFAERPAPGYVTPPSWLRQGQGHAPRPRSGRLQFQRLQLQQVPQRQEVYRDGDGDGDLNYVTPSEESIDSTVEVEHTWRPYHPVVEGPAIAAHFVADSSRHRSSHHFDGNGRLKHPLGDYGDWKASPWVQELGLDKHFRIADSGSSGGTVVVDTAGLYLVYAQVNYANEKDENGFWVYRNGQKELLCVTTAPAASSGSGTARANTCFTAGVLHLRSGDRVTLRDLAGDRYRVLDHSGRSFIGLVNLQGCRLKAEQPSRLTARRE